MSHRKFSANRIFNGRQFLDEDKVIITDAEGLIVDLINPENAGGDIESFEGILAPGLVNCHAHLELSHMRGKIPEQTGLVDFVTTVVSERHIPEEKILASIAEAEKEMLSNGIIAVGDICNNLLTLPQKTRANLRYHNFIEAIGFPSSVAVQRFQRSFDLYKKYREISPSSIVPHATYSVSDELFGLIRDLPGNELVSIHNQETAGEDELFYSGSGELLELYEKMKIDRGHFRHPGTTSLRHYLTKLGHRQQAILVHNVFTRQEDIEFAGALENKIYWCLCPNANLYITGQLPPVDLFIKEQCTMVLGTDSLASNHQLDILSEIRQLRKKYPDLSDETVLTWATSNGASALMMDKELGSIEPGKKPALVLISEDLTGARRLI